MSNITIPNFGESVNSATISRWHFNTGDHVKAGDTLVTLETDKVASDLEADETGTLTITTGEGEDVGIGDIIGFIGQSDLKQNTPAVAKPVEKQAVESAPTQATIQPAEQAPSEQHEPSSETERYVRKPMSRLRRTIASKLVDIQHQAAILTTFNECDMSAIKALRKQFKESIPEGSTAKLGMMSFFIKAVTHALIEVPSLNARIDGNDLIENKYYDISIAIGSKNGLVVPVIRDCDQKNHFEIEKELTELVAKANDGSLQLSDLQGGVFTISNGGTYGSMLSTPILNPPQSGILGMHAIIDRPVAKDGQIVIRPMMYLALSYDHRIIDGQHAVTFLIKIKEHLENPLLEV